MQTSYTRKAAVLRDSIKWPFCSLLFHGDRSASAAQKPSLNPRSHKLITAYENSSRVNEVGNECKTWSVNGVT